MTTTLAERALAASRLPHGELAELIGVTPDALHHWRAERRQPTAAARTLLTMLAEAPAETLELIERTRAVHE